MVMQLFKENKLIPEDRVKVQTFEEYSKNWWIWDKCTYLKAERARGRELSRSYCDTCRRSLEKHVLPVFKNKLLTAINPGDVEKWLFTLINKKNLSPKTANNTMSVLSVMLEDAARKKVVPENPCKRVKQLMEDTSGRGVLTSVEAKELLSDPGLWKNNLAYIGNLLAAVSGMRAGEIRALRGQDIKADHLHVQHSFDPVYGLKSTKTGDIRDLPLPAPVMELLHSIKHGDEDFLFTVTVKKPVGDKFFLDGLYDALEKIGIGEAERKRRKISMHSWRHYLNSQLLAHGISEVKTRRITGHATQEMTAHYTHFTVEDYKDILEITTGIWQ